MLRLAIVRRMNLCPVNELCVLVAGKLELYILITNSCAMLFLLILSLKDTKNSLLLTYPSI